MTGIALSGWDRMGWSGGLAERWMRLRDRRSIFAALLLCAAYAAGVLWAFLWVAGSTVLNDSALLALLLKLNILLLAWRLAMRFAFVAAAYGLAEGVRAVPRVVIANIIAMMAARRALAGYFTGRRTGETRWDKTRHVFPAAVPAE